MSGPRLATPDAACHSSFLGALGEDHAEARNLDLDLVLLADPDEFARYVAALCAGVVDPWAPDRYVLATFGVWPSDQPEDAYVPQTVLWWTHGSECLGRLNIRHHLNERLLCRADGRTSYPMLPPRPSRRSLRWWRMLRRPMYSLPSVHHSTVCGT